VNLFDVETGPSSPEVLERVKPKFEAARNLKDPAKIAAAVAEKEETWRDMAALDATTGTVLCVGVASGSSVRIIEGEERDLLRDFWQWLTERIGAGEQVAGFNIYGFDLPMLIRRSWILGVSVPRSIRKGRYWHDNLIDVMDVWTCGNRDQRISLDNLSKALGVGEKNGSGKDFAALWASDRIQAIAYLKQDLSLTRKVAERVLGIQSVRREQPELVTV
jgi:predicted PolB exonuclease-like 3'-5' exonuclease